MKLFRKQKELTPADSWVLKRKQFQQNNEKTHKQIQRWDRPKKEGKKIGQTATDQPKRRCVTQARKSRLKPGGKYNDE